MSAWPAFGQAAPPAFDVASVKPSDPNQIIAIKRSGNHIATVTEN